MVEVSVKKGDKVNKLCYGRIESEQQEKKGKIKNNMDVRIDLASIEVKSWDESEDIEKRKGD